MSFTLWAGMSRALTLMSVREIGGSRNLLPAFGAAAGAAGSFMSGFQAERRAQLDQSRLRLAAQSEEVVAEERAAQRLQDVNRIVASNSARLGAAGIRSSQSAAAVDEQSVREAARAIRIERSDAAMRANMARLEADLLDPNRYRTSGLIRGGAQLFRGFTLLGSGT